ncbi:unnamed protein product, partial [Ectocarpus sp. 8 AP-2014]
MRYRAVVCRGAWFRLSFLCRFTPIHFHFWHKHEKHKQKNHVAASVGKKKLMLHPPITLCPPLAQLQKGSNGSLCLHRWAKKSSAPFSNARLASSNHSKKKNTTGREPMAGHPHDNSPDNVRPTHKVQRTPQVLKNQTS